MDYQEMIVEATGYRRSRGSENRPMATFTVRVQRSPAGETAEAAAVEVVYDVRQLEEELRRLEARELSKDGLIALGRALGALLLSPGENAPGASVADLFADSLKLIGQDAGLRLRLQLPPELAVLPWEFMYVDRAGGGDGMDGFLALDPRIAIVRHEMLAVPAPAPAAPGDIRILAAFASHMDLPALDLARERADLEQVFADQPGVDVTFLDHATLDDIQGALPGARIFHFAGHGAFARAMGDAPGTYSGTGYLALDDAMVDAEQLGINLRGSGIRLAVLGGCETGRRDQVSVWSGVAPALVKAEVPAVVANQYAVTDAGAIAFSRAFYRALVGGLPVERAVTAGRIVAFNADNSGVDWGVPVLYLRAGSGLLFEGATDAATRTEARERADANVRLRIQEVAAGGDVLGGVLRRAHGGTLNVEITVSGTVFGTVVGATVGSADGSADVEMDLGTVGAGGTVVGAVIGEEGGEITIGGHHNYGPTYEAGSTHAEQTIQATGPGAVVAGGDIKESTIVTGDDNTIGDTQIDTGGGAYVGGDVKTEGDFVGRDKIVHGDEVHGDKTAGDKIAGDKVGGDKISVGDISGSTGIAIGAGASSTVQQGVSGEQINLSKLVIYQGDRAVDDLHGRPVPPGTPQDPEIEERIRLDAVLPRRAVLDEPFDLGVAVRRTDSPPLTVDEVAQTTSAPGSIYRTEENEIVDYRIDVNASGCTVVPTHYVLRLHHGTDSPLRYFQITPQRPGKRSILINAYQVKDAALAAQSRVSIQVDVSVDPPGG